MVGGIFGAAATFNLAKAASHLTSWLNGIKLEVK